MHELRRSWVESANSPATPFPLNNLPYGVFSTGDGPARCGVAIGDQVLDLSALEAAGVLAFGGALSTGNWNRFMALGPASWAALRATLTEALSEALSGPISGPISGQMSGPMSGPMSGAQVEGAPRRAAFEPALVALSDVQLHLPFRVSEFTDFYASRHHATHVGTMFRGLEAALPPNWLHLPIGYNGRASSVVVSGTDVIRPHGQIMDPGATRPRFAPSARFDLELELGAIVGQPSDGPLSVAEAFDAIFGYVLLNDWSARDIQAWEYQPLGPFQSKATATTISPWIVTAAALAPFRTRTPPPEVPLLPYLHAPEPMLYDIALEVGLTPPGGVETLLTRTNASELYYSAAQQLAHHSSSGCPMRVGDLLGSGTISGAAPGARGSLLEISWGGTEPVTLPDGTQRSFLEDGDTLTLRGAAQGDGYQIGFGSCVGCVRPARVR